MRSKNCSNRRRFSAAPARFPAAPVHAWAVFASAAVALTALPAPTQDCDGSTWSTAFTSGRLDGTPHIFRSMDDGTLLAGGRFEHAGGLPALNIARWDGDSWHPMGDGLPFRVRTVEEFDSGNGPVLYACGSLIDGNNDGGARVAAWDGQSWSIIADGPDGGVRASAIFDDGSGPALYCLGSFTQIAGIPAAGAARFDGHTWTALGSGLTGYANAAAVYDDPDAPGAQALFVGGKITAAGGAPVKGLARWNGSEWSDVDGGVTDKYGYPGAVNALAVHAEAGDVARLYVGGDFAGVGDNIPSLCAAAWNPAGWTDLTGIVDPVYECAVMAQGNSEFLWTAASRSLQQGYYTTTVYTLTGTQWTQTDHEYVPGQAFALASHPFHGQPTMHIGTAYDGVVWAWSDDTWLALGKGFIDVVTAMVEFDRGNGPELLVSGRFDQVAGMKVGPGTAVWNGHEWNRVAASGDDAMKLAVFDDGDGPAVYAAFPTFYGRVHRLSGDKWIPVGQVTYATGTDLIVFDGGSGPALYSCGGDDFDAGLFGVARLQGNTWVAVGQGLTGGNGTDALAVYNDGTGPALYAAGDFEYSGDKKMPGIARWDGTKWTPVGKGLSVNDYRKTVAVFNDADGPALFVAGRFTQAGHVPVTNIARWDGTQWSALGDGVNGQVESMAVFDDGFAPALYVSGAFSSAGGVPARGLAKWSRSSWQPVGSGFDAYGSASVMIPSSLDGGSLFLGGNFDSADGVSSGNFAQLVTCHTCFADLDRDGALTLFDFLAFVNAFNASDPAADCDHSGSLDLFDFLCFTNAFNAGC